jgi:serine/threonine protein kinase
MIASHPEPGDLIEDYEILERIGGNMGFVFKARHRLLNKVVVLKLVPAECITDPASLARFQREVRVMGQLEHPNLVTAADARKVGDWHLVAMEWIDGADLQQLLRARGPLPVAAACEAARQAAQGLQYAHQHGLIHRDIKPSNLMLTRAGVLKVIDMGLALIREDSAAQLTKTGLVLGTMSYCAPEQFRDPSHVDIRVDIYSLGCTLYHLLAGKPPYSERKTFAEVVEAHLHAPFPSLAGALPDIPPGGLDAVLARMTAKDREERFSTPGEVSEALESFARGASLGPLVPARTPQVPPARIKDSKPTPKPEGQRGAAGGQTQPKGRWSRRAALFALGGGIAGAAYLISNGTKNGPVPPNPDPVILLMDTTARDGVYREENKDSNATDVADVLMKYDLLPSRSLHKEPITENWDRFDFVRNQHPDLVIIHRSAFFHTKNAKRNLGSPDDGFAMPREDQRWVDLYHDEDDFLILFFALVGALPRNPDTQFLVYSRGTGPLWNDSKKQEWLAPGFQEYWKMKIATRFPDLKGRIHTMTITREKEGSILNPETSATLRNEVRRILHLPGKPEPVPDIPPQPE